MDQMMEKILAHLLAGKEQMMAKLKSRSEPTKNK
jgi:hypothetical protein